jgi:ferric-dicitrate binding protein FerR (iron transport regulator)
MTTEDDDVGALVKLANTSDPIVPLDEGRVARVRTAVHGAWRDEYVARPERSRRRWLVIALPLAAAASIVIAFAIWSPIRVPASVRTPVPMLVAHVDQVTGQATGQIGGSPAPFTAGGAVTSGATVTTSVGTVAMTLTSGVHLRLDGSTVVRVDSATDVALERGAVYVDSADAQPIGPVSPGASPISIHTPAGLVRDIGTQFQVRIDVRPGGAGIRVRVRHGQVSVTDANGGDVRAGAGEELLSDGSALSRRPIAVTGSEWAWAERAAPAFFVEGKSLGAFLDWVNHEGAWTVTFADTGLSEDARAIVLHGNPDLLRGVTSAEALDVVLRICGLRYRIDGHRVVIERETK